MFTEKINIITILFIVFAFISCSEKDKQAVKEDVDLVSKDLSRNVDTLMKNINPGDTLFNGVEVKKVVVSKNISEETHDKLDDIFDLYEKIKDELSENDSADAKSHALDLLKLVNKYSNDTDRIEKQWRLDNDKFLKYQKEIEKTDNLADQRDWFDKLTAVMLEAVQKYGMPGKTIYEIRSSGYVKGKNGVWLTSSKNSSDPYGGKKAVRDNVKVIQGWEFESN